MALSSIVEFFYIWKLMIVYTIAVLIIFALMMLLWKYRYNTSKFIWNPAPLVQGIWLYILGIFYRNSTTKILLELEKLLNSLSDDVPIIVILGEKDIVKNYVFETGDDKLCWYFINKKIYFYIMDLNQVEFIINFLKSIKSNRCVNSIVLKLSYEESIPKNKLDYIRLTVGYCLPIYLVFKNLNWSIYLHNNIEDEILGFLIRENKNIREEYHALFNVINYKLINNDKYSIDFNGDYYSHFDNLVMTTETLMQVKDYKFRGVFFSLSSDYLYSIGENNNNYVANTFFISYMHKIVEEEVFLGTPIQGLVIIPRYKSLHKLLMFFLVFFGFFYLLIQYKNIASFYIRYNDFIENIQDITSNIDNKNSEERKNYVTYEILNRIGEINLSNMYSHFFPHKYMLKNIYEDLCEIEDLLSFFSFKHISKSTNKNYEEDLMNLYDYIIRVVEMENHIFSHKKTYRFGIYTKRSEKSIENAKLSFSSTLKEIHTNVLILYNRFAKSLEYHPIKITFKRFDDSFNIFMSKGIYTIEGIKNIINLHKKLLSFIINKIIIKDIIKIEKLSKNLKNSIIFSDNISNKITPELDEYTKNFMYEISHLKQQHLGFIFIFDINKKIIEFNKEVTSVIDDLKNFINEPIMNNYIPINSVVNINDNKNFSYWNLGQLQNVINQDISENTINNILTKYSPKVKNTLLFICKKNSSKSIFNKVLQYRITKPFEGLNDIKNFHDSLSNITILLDFFQSANDIETYNNMINIIKNDLYCIDNYIERELYKNIFFNINKYKLKLQNSIYENLFFTNDVNTVTSSIEEDLQNIIFINENFIREILMILNNRHLGVLKSKNFIKYINILQEIEKYKQGKNNSFNRFRDFIMSLENFDYYKNNKILTDKKVINNNIIDNNLYIFKEDLKNLCNKNIQKYLEKNYSQFHKEFKNILNYYPFNRNSSSIITTKMFMQFLDTNNEQINIFKNINIKDLNLYESNILNKLYFYKNNIFQNYKGHYIKTKFNILVKEPFNHKTLKPLENIIIDDIKYDINKLSEKDVSLYFHNELIIRIPLKSNNNKINYKINKIINKHYSITRKGHYLEMKFNNFWCFYRFLMKQKHIIEEDKVIFKYHVPLSNSHLHIHIIFDKNLFFSLPI
ncbi:hypothetical protein AB836_00025 [Rickettsiales bacterium (ex Bugula neritina AB1)]|nr:hypothetical protein AB836_00025 [Rickettsiales bacterium (ex Bugula neritina AB1)]